MLKEFFSLSFFIEELLYSVSPLQTFNWLLLIRVLDNLYSFVVMA